MASPMLYRQVAFSRNCFQSYIIFVHLAIKKPMVLVIQFPLNHLILLKPAKLVGMFMTRGNESYKLAGLEPIASELNWIIPIF